MEHRVAVSLAIRQMDGIFVAIELSGRNSELLLPPLALDPGGLSAAGPGLEGSNAERLTSAIGCHGERDMREQDLRRVGVGGLNASQSFSLTIIAIGEGCRIVNDQIVASRFAT